MDLLKSFLSKRTRGELTLLAIMAAIAVLVAGIKTGELLALINSHA